MMGTMARTLWRGIAALSLSLLGALAYAQDNESYAPDPPGRAARLSYLEGEVSMQPAGEEEWAPAILNRPLTTGDKLWTERDARAEIQVGPAAVRLGNETGFSFLNVDDDTVQMRLTAGVINVSLRALRDDEQIEIATPNVAVSILRPGSYRIEVDDAGDSTVVKVSEGSAEATGSGQDVIVHARQMVTFTGLDDLVARTRTLDAPDEFDDWTLERDRLATRAASSRTAEYVSPDVTGYEDLDDHGSWSSEPEYGYVWTPRYVAVDWAPYRYGRWVWVSPWGWTWIDDARWGYAPFHYGRWAHIRHRWCWVPGPRHVRAVYAPALVAWVGSPGISVSWFPLGPREIYMPGRRYSRRYWDRVNVSNTVIVNRSHISELYENRAREIIYRNRTAPGGVTAASRTAFTLAERIGERRIRLSERDVASALATAAAPRIAPARESRLGGPTRANVRTPPRTIVDRQVVVRRDPPPTVARFARSTAASRDLARTSESFDRPTQRGRIQDRPDNEGIERVIRERQDRPPRAQQPPAIEPTPPAQSSVFDRRAIAGRVREDSERQAREQQQREAVQQREAEQRDYWQRENDQARRRQQWQESRDSQQQARELIRRRQDDADRQPAARQPEPRERPRAQVERPQVERPQAERPRAERPQAEQPRAQQPQRSEPQNPPASRPQQHRRPDGNERSRKD
jgi:hypothetical protein